MGYLFILFKVNLNLLRLCFKYKVICTFGSLFNFIKFSIIEGLTIFLFIKPPTSFNCFSLVKVLIIFFSIISLFFLNIIIKLFLNKFLRNLKLVLLNKKGFLFFFNKIICMLLSFFIKFFNSFCFFGFKYLK